MSEPMIFKITNQAAWDGTTKVNVTREAFQQEGRFYTGTIEKGGVLRGDFFGLFSGSAPKLVAIAVDSYDPRVRAWVAPPNDYEHSRFALDLTPAYQSVFMAGTDVLRLNSQHAVFGGSRKVTLVVNELSEAEAVRCVAGSLHPKARMRRARILRTDDQAFAVNTTHSLLPSAGLVYQQSSGYLLAKVGSQGWVAVYDLVDTGYEGVYVWVRFTGLSEGSGEIFRIDTRTDETHAVATGLVSLEWSQPLWMGWDDRLCFRTTSPVNNSPLAVEIEVSQVGQRRA